MHAQAKQNTEDSLAYLVYQQHAKTEELNKLGETVLKDAKMELYVAQMEGVRYDDLSTIAQRVHDYPNLTIKSKFRGQGFLLEDGNGGVLPDDSKLEPASWENINIKESHAVVDEPATENSATLDAEIVQPIQTAPVVKNFCKMQPAYPVGSKKYKTAVLKPAREIVKAAMDQFVRQKIDAFVRENSETLAADASIDLAGIPTYKTDIETYSLISAMYECVMQGKKYDYFDVNTLSSEAEIVRDLDCLAYTIISNAERFRADNPELTDGDNLTAANIKQYYRELGKSESPTGNILTGQQIIVREICDDVAEIMSR